MPPPIMGATGARAGEPSAPAAASAASAAPAAAVAPAAPAVDEVMVGPQRTGNWQGVGYPDSLETEDDSPAVSTWGVGELKRYLGKHSVAIEGACEKTDLVRMVLAHQQGTQQTG